MTNEAEILGNDSNIRTTTEDEDLKQRMKVANSIEIGLKQQKLEYKKR